MFGGPGDGPSAGGQTHQGVSEEREHGSIPKLKADDFEFYYDETGSGFLVIFCHEFAGDRRSWEPQVRHFARRYRVITTITSATRRLTCRPIRRTAR
jgi:hypothetical protein